MFKEGPLLFLMRCRPPCSAQTYFTIVLKGKAKTSPLVKTGVLIVKRDPREQMMEVVFWKELQN